MIQLDNFILKNYNFLNGEHKSVLDELGNNIATQKYLGNLEYMLQRIRQRNIENNIDEFYIAYYGVDEDAYPIGFISISVINDKPELSIGILPKYRGQNLAPLLTQEFAEYIFENTNIEELFARIDSTNKSSIKAATLSGYEKNNEGSYSMRK